ncbi:hypothetical protein NM208_g977 [Fusarium decemcellulare]|uniref:Uncharacterized protein n=1 Tax=Fusarium decemcellulare TaxID=57161 RepID=A0ACC1SXG6_9HYPO|nr:hypothetical protein NM208_g977 [Fusarium decemcellulare]
MTINENKPVIILVCGAWHRPSHYKQLAESLESRGFSVHQPENVTAGDASAIKGKTHLDDAAVINRAMEAPLSAGKDIVLVCHSYGGIPGSAAVEGRQCHERQDKGLQGGIKHVVFITSFALPAKGMSLRTAIGGTYGPFMDRTDDVIVLNDKAGDTLYNDIDEETTRRALSDCVHQSTASFETAASFVAPDITVPKTYVGCENDQAVPIEGQLAMAGAMGDSVRIEKLSSGHSPQLNPEFVPRLVDIIERAAG